MNHTGAVAVRLVVILSSGAAALVVVRDGGGWLLVLAAALAVRFALRGRWPGTGTTHGRAAFCGTAEARAAGMAAFGSGLHLGELVDPGPRPALLPAAVDLFTAPLAASVEAVETFRAALGVPRPPVRLCTNNFHACSIIGASRSGKGSGVLLPTLLTYPGAVLVLDPKGEMYTQTASARRAMGRRVLCIDPYRVVLPGGGGDCYNPLSFVTAGERNPLVTDVAKEFSTALVVRTGQERERFFADASEQLLQTFLAAVLWGGGPDDRNIVTVADLIADPKLYANTLAALQQSDAYGGILRMLGHQAAQLEGREKASVLNSIAAQHLSWLSSQPVRDTVRTSTFDPLWLKTPPAGSEPVDLFIVLPPEKLRSAAGFTRFLLTGLLRRLTQGAPDESNPVLVILDEIACCGGHLPVLEDAVCLFAGWGLKLVFVWQTAIGQIQDLFPGDKAKTFMANMSLRVFAKTNDLEGAKIVSEGIGDATVLGTSTQDGGSYSRSSGADGRPASGQWSTSWSVTRSETQRRVLKPEEVLALPPDLMVVLSDRTRPMLVRQVRHYSPEFWPGSGRAGGRRGGSGSGRLALFAVVLCFVLLALADCRGRRAPRQAVPGEHQFFPDPDTGRPAGGVPNRPTRGSNDGQENWRRARDGNVQTRPGRDP